MNIGVLKETKTLEKRVAIIPSTVKDLTKKGYTFCVEKDAGNLSHYSNQSFIDAGAKLVEKNDVFNCDIVIKVNTPTEDEIRLLNSNSLLISLFQTIKDIDLVRTLKEKQVSAFSLNLLPRTTLAQKMDVLSSQASISGYKSVLIGAHHIGKYMPLLMTPAGTISPARTLIIGAGVAGLQAIATARRLGSQVQAFDVRPEVKEQVESLGAKFVEIESDSDDGVGSGGYAKETSEEYKKRQQEVMKERSAKSYLVITTALVPNRPAPTLIPTSMVDLMQPGSVIMDLAAENGGNCEYTKPGDVIDHNGITIDGSFNIPGTMSIHASQVYAKNISALVTYLCPEGELKLDMDDEIVSGALFTHNGEITNEQTKEALGVVA
mgnify:CR=1 FL=1